MYLGQVSSPDTIFLSKVLSLAQACEGNSPCFPKGKAWLPGHWGLTAWQGRVSVLAGAFIGKLKLSFPAQPESRCLGVDFHEGKAFRWDQLYK